MINPVVFIKEPLSFKNKIKVYPPSVREVVSNLKYNQYVKLLTITQEDIQDELTEKNGQQAPTDSTILTPFSFLFLNCFHNKQFCSIAMEAFEFFIHQPVNFVYDKKIIIVGEPQEILTQTQIEKLVIITEEEYFDFQNIIREACGEKTVLPPEPPNPDEDPRITQMKAKARYRDRIKAKQNAKNGISISTCLVAICCMGIGLTPLNIGEMSYAAIGPIMNMSQEKEKYDIDIRSLLAGADSKKVKPKYWIRNSNKD